jgi:hypothetical protein
MPGATAVPQTTYDNGMVGGTTYSGTSTTYVQQPGYNITATCNVTYVLFQGVVQSYSYQGNNCVQ